MNFQKPFLLLSVLVIACWLVLTGEAHAGVIDQGTSWVLSAIAGVIAGAAGLHVAQKAGVAAIPASPLQKPPILPTATAPVDVYKVWYATNRQLRDGQFNSDYSDELLFGDCQVAVPKSYKFGSIGSKWNARLIQRLTGEADDEALRIVKQSNWSREEGAHGLVTSIAGALTKDANQILVYVHGYNVSFQDAILRAAQIGFDLKVPGVTAAFCWASKAEKSAYLADEDTIKLTAPQLAEFLGLLKTSFPERTINILAHSMGNRALIDVLQNIDRYPALADAKFGQLILAAPDIDGRYFLKVAAVYPRLSARTTLYVCAADRALQFSGAGHADERIGYCPPVTVVSGIDTIEATNVSLDAIGHSYYAEASSVLIDMFTLLRQNISPIKRVALVKATTADGKAYWQL